MATTYGKPVLTAWQGIGSQVLTVNVVDSTGTAYDLTGMTVTVSGSLDGTYKLESVSCTLDADPTSGTITFTPSAGELDTTGAIECQLRIDNGGAIAFTYPFILQVTAVQYSAGA